MSTRRARTFKLPESARPAADINVTPLVDVVLVLLIIFMVVTPLMERDIDVVVPQSESVEEKSKVPEEQILVSLSAEGEIRVNDQIVSGAELQSVLQEKLSRLPEAERAAYFNLSGRAAYPQMILVLDAAQQAGAKNLGILGEPVSTAEGGDPAGLKP